jgi:hypothetical protein
MDKETWDAEMKHWRVKNPIEWYAGGNCCATVTQSDGTIRCILCLSEITKRRSLQEQINVLTHEATHVWQTVKRHIWERDPGTEQEAYFVAWVVEWLFMELFGDYKPLRLATANQ